MSLRRVELLSALVMSMLILYGFYLTSLIDLTLSSELETFTGPRAYPRIILAGMFVLALMLVGKAWANRQDDEIDSGPVEPFHPRLTKVAMALLILVIFAALFEPLGYLLTLVPLLMAIGYLNGADNLARNATYSILSMATCLVIFRYGLNTVLPEGLLGIDQIF